MLVAKTHPCHTYRLVLADDERGPARIIEFEAPYPDSALYLAQQQCRGREAELFEDERSLGRIMCAPQGGFWMLSPARAAGQD
jgi:hypothetical protein